MANPTSLRGLTVVLTGASSGIGKAIALTLATEGANLVLASRRETILQEIASECEVHGGNAIAVKTDVTEFEEIQHLMETALEHFGTVDVWINNAGVLAAGEFTETPLEVHEQVVKVNLLGPLYGTYTALSHFKEMNKGTIISTVSLGAFVPSPYSAAYSASKFGLRGMDEAIRFEMSRFPDIHLCDINPAQIDTPVRDHAANYTGGELKSGPAFDDPFKVADAVVSLIRNPKDSIMVGSRANAVKIARSLFPKFIGRKMSQMAEKYFYAGKRVPPNEGTLFDENYSDSETHREH